MRLWRWRRCCALSATTVIAAEKVYINGIDANFPPFAYVDKSGDPDGFDVKALDWIAKEMRFKVKHQPMDWDGIIPSLKAKKIDIVASGISITDERKKQVNFTIPYWKIKQVLVAKKMPRSLWIKPWRTETRSASSAGQRKPNGLMRT